MDSIRTGSVVLSALVVVLAFALAHAYGGRVAMTAAPDAVSELGALSDLPAGHVLVEGNYAFVASEQRRLVVVDVTDPAAPSEVGSIDPAWPVLGFDIEGSLMFVAAGDAGLRVLDLADPTAPVEIGAYDPSPIIEEVQVDGSLAVLRTSVRAITVNVLDPTSPQPTGVWEVPFYGTRGTIEGVAVRDTHIYAAVSRQGLYVVDVGDPSTPQGVLVAPGSARWVVLGTSVGAVHNSAVTTLLDIAELADPVVAGTVPTALGGLQSATLRAGRMVAVARSADGRDHGIEVFDVSDPDAPRAIAALATWYWPTHVALGEGFAAVSAGYDGLRFIDVSDPEGTPMPPETPSTSVAGSIALAGGVQSIIAPVGFPVDVRVQYRAYSAVADVTHLRAWHADGGACPTEFRAPQSPWEPFVDEATRPAAPSRWTRGFMVTVQYRDAHGNLSVPVCDSVTIERVDAPTPTAATPTPTVTPTTVVDGSVSLELAGGPDWQCVSFGDVPITGVFTSTSPAAPVDLMRVDLNLSYGCAGAEDRIRTAWWEPLRARKAYSITAGAHLVHAAMAAQYQDSLGNLSPVYCVTGEWGCVGTPTPRPWTPSPTATAGTPSPTATPRRGNATPTRTQEPLTATTTPDLTPSPTADARTPSTTPDARTPTATPGSASPSPSPTATEHGGNTTPTITPTITPTGGTPPDANRIWLPAALRNTQVRF